MKALWPSTKAYWPSAGIDKRYPTAQIVMQNYPWGARPSFKGVDVAAQEVF